MLDGDGVSFGIVQTGQGRDQFTFQLLRLLGSNRAVRFPAAQVQIQATQAERIGGGARPIDVRKILAAFGCPVFRRRKITVLMEPGVQIDSAIERAESVVGKNE